MVQGFDFHPAETKQIFDKPGKVFVIDGFRNLDSRDINLGGCGQQKSLVHSANIIY